MAETGAKNNTIIIKRIKKAGHGAHGGAWKVAYADFVTAMMAFFLLLWLLNSVTEEQLQGISDYFAPAAASISPSGAGGMLGGRVIGEGASQSNASPPTAVFNVPPSAVGPGGSDVSGTDEGINLEDVTDEDLQTELRAREQAQFEDVAEALREAASSIPELKKVQDSLIVDNSPEGLRIQLIDQEGLPMFPVGSSNMYAHTQHLLQLVARTIKNLPQKIAIAGHTDANGFSDLKSGYSDWELSADRALAARRVLNKAGIPDNRLARVSGKAGNDPLNPNDPDAPGNRRISVVLMRDSLSKTEAQGHAQSIGSPPLPSIIDD